MFEAYSIGIRVSLINGVSNGLIQMARQFGSANIAAKELESRLASIKKTMLIGGALTGAGLGLFWLIGKTVGPAKEYAHQLALMNAAGMKNVEITKAQKAAYDALNFAPTSSITDNLAAIRELRMVFGNTQAAISNMPTVQRLQAILAVQHGDDMGRGGEDAYTVAKALELKGAVRTPGEFNTQADMMAKAIMASGGKVGPQDFLSAFKYGRNATAGWSDQFVYTILPTLIQEMKSSGGSGGAGGPGNALMSAFAAVVGGTISNKALPNWERLGLIDPSKVIRTKTGSVKGVMPGGIVGASLFQQNPFAWAQEVLNPALAKAGINTDDQRRQMLQYLFQNRTAGFIMSQMSTQGWKFTRDQGLIQQAQGLAGYDQLMKNDPFMAQLALQKQWNSLMATLGFSIMPDLLKMMNALIPMIRSFTQWAHDNPNGLTMVMRGLVALATILTAAGIITLISGVAQALSLVAKVIGIGKWVPWIGRAAAGFGRLASLGWSALVAGVGGLDTALGGLALIPLGAIAIGVVALTGALVGLAIVGPQLWKGFQQNLDSAPNSKLSPLQGTIDFLTGESWWMHDGDKAKAKSPHVHPASYSGGAKMQGAVYIDGQKAGRIILGGAVKRASGPAVSGAGFDGSADYTPVGTGLIGT